MRNSLLSPPPPTGRVTTALLAGFCALAPVAIDMYLPALPTIASQLHATPGQATGTLSVFLTGLALGQLVIGPLSDRIGRRSPLIAGLICFILATAFAAQSETIGQLLAARLAQGLGGAAVTVTSRAIVRDMFDHSGAARFFSLLMLIGGLAPILAPSLGSLLMGAGGWRLIFHVTGMAGALLMIGAIFVLPETRLHDARLEARQDHPLRGYLLLVSNRRLLGYLLAGAFNMASFFAYLASAPLVFMQVYGLKPWPFSLLVACNAIGLVGASQFNRWLLKRHHPDRLLQASGRNAAIIAIPAAVFALTNMGGLPVLLAILFVVLASNSVIQANAMAGALSVDPVRSGSIAALFGAIGFGAGTLGSLLAGLLFDGTPRAMMAIIAIGLLGTSLAVRMIPRTGERESEARPT